MQTTNNQTSVSPAAVLDEARQELVQETTRGAAGRAAVERHADRIDALLLRLFKEAPPAGQPVAIMALGGYGRRHLCLHSDVDVLVLFAGAIGADDERCLRGFLHPLWDLGLAVGHQVRELDDFARLETDNPEFLLALLDARVVAGDSQLFDRFKVLFHQPRAHAFILRSLEELMAARHAQFNNTLYQLEPDVKEAPGALRDLTATRTIVGLTDPLLLRSGPVTSARLEAAEDFFLRIRSVLHLDARRNQNVLSHQLQEKTAETLGYPGTHQQRVERLMGDYFRHARVVHRALEWICRAAPVPVGANLGRLGNAVRFVNAQQAAVQPETWLSVFQAALDEGCAVADEATSCIGQHADRFGPRELFPTAAERAALLAFLRPRAGLYARLSQMHDCGLLGRIFPEFQAIAGRVVRDFYHKYTVDEHTLQTIRNLERLTEGAAPDRERFCSLLSDVHAPELLVLALLFHDVGKWRDDDHTVESVRMARLMFDRLDLPAETRDLVEFLIGNHLRMSEVAFRRDTEDPEVVRRFAALVGIEERLKMLCLMTLVDIAAVSPETLTPWKEELLWRLYVDTYNQLTLGYGDELIVPDQTGLAELIAGRPPDLSEIEIASFLEGLPRRYLQSFAHDVIYRHVRLSHDIHPDEIHVSLEQKGAAWELAVVTLDKPFLFSNICGVLASFGMDILRGNAMTSPKGLVLDVFQFTDEERFLELNQGAKDQFLHVLDQVVSGRTDVTERLRGRAQGIFHRRRPVRFAPVIHWDNQSSRRYTILDIITGDALGLLYRISRVISQNRCDVDLVLISTEGEKAIDVFHITKGGAKLSEAEQRELTANLQRMLEEGNEAD